MEEEDWMKVESIDRICKPHSRLYKIKHWFKRKTNRVFHWYEVYAIDREEDEWFT